MGTLEPEVERKLAMTWPSAPDRANVRVTLLTYGSVTSEREVERVRLAILKLSDGALDELRAMTAVAKTDYRDVLMWAEYPETSKATWTVRSDLSETERRERAAMR